MNKRRRGVLAWMVGMAGVAPGARAHGSRLGDILVEHPYALASLPGNAGGAVYFRALRNTGSQPDRLLGASTPVAGAIEIHHMTLDEHQVMRMRVADALPLPPASELRLMHGGAWHLMLRDVRTPLREGDRFAVTLRFERAGTLQVTAWAQGPRDAHAH